MQEFILIIAFVAATGYLGRRFYLQHLAKKEAGCGSNCGCEPASKPLGSVKPRQ